MSCAPVAEPLIEILRFTFNEPPVNVLTSNVPDSISKLLMAFDAVGAVPRLIMFHSIYQPQHYKNLYWP